jgi:hypothetical protein
VLEQFFAWAAVNPLSFSMLIWIFMFLRSRLMQRIALRLGIDQDNDGRVDWRDCLGYFASIAASHRWLQSAELASLHSRLVDSHEEEVLQGRPSLDKIDLRLDRLEDFIHKGFTGLWAHAQLGNLEPPSPLAEVRPQNRRRKGDHAASTEASTSTSTEHTAPRAAEGARSMNAPVTLPYAELSTRLHAIEQATAKGFAALSVSAGPSPAPTPGISSTAPPAEMDGEQLGKRLQALENMIAKGFAELIQERSRSA